MLRFIHTHTLFSAEQLASQFGLGVAVVDEQLALLREQGLVLCLHQQTNQHESAWISEENFRRLRLRSPVQHEKLLALFLRISIPACFWSARILPTTDGSAALFNQATQGIYEGTEGVVRVIEQLAGLGIPASLWESQIFPARVQDYSTEMLDELLATGVVVWSGQRKLGEDDGLVALHLQEYCAETLTLPPLDAPSLSPLQRAILRILASGGAWFAQQISLQVTPQPGDANQFHEALWGWSGKDISPVISGHHFAH